MKIVVIGATGTVGRHLVSQALSAGHTVRAFARNPKTLEILHESLSLVAGDVLDYDAVEGVVKGADAVCITLGSKQLTGKLRSIGTKNVINAMVKHGVKRLICQTSLGIGDSRANLDFYWKYLMFGFLLRFVAKDHLVQEALVRESGLNWTIVRPSAFTDGPVSLDYKQDFPVTDRDLTLKISRATVANFLLQQVDSTRYQRKAVGISE